MGIFSSQNEVKLRIKKTIGTEEELDGIVLEIITRLCDGPYYADKEPQVKTIELFFDDEEGKII